VRAPMIWEGRTVFTKFHEGIDIAPVEFDGTGQPRDLVRAISAGLVVYCHSTPQGSDYGNHVVIEHDWGCGPVYSLYAHLARVDVRAGERVDRGTSLGMLGHTGTGIGEGRAHLHLEVDLMLDDAFEPSRWRPTPQPAGKFDRLNLAGIDPAALFLAAKDDAMTTLPLFFATLKPYFRVEVPRREKIDLLRRHPWLAPENSISDALACEISFTAWGLPIKFAPSKLAVSNPQVTWVEPFAGKHGWHTGGLLSGSGPSAVLTPRGTALIQVIMGEAKK
jgi:Peptidase family M23